MLSAVVAPATKRKAAGTAAERPKRTKKEISVTVGTPSAVEDIPLVPRKATRARKGSKAPLPASQGFLEAYIASKTISQHAASDPSLGEVSVHPVETLSPLKPAENAETGGQDDTKIVDSEATDDDLMIMDTSVVTPVKASQEISQVEAPKELSPTLQAEQSTDLQIKDTHAEIPTTVPSVLPSDAKSQHSSSAPNSSKLLTKKSMDKAESTAKPSSSTQTLAAELNINLPMGFDYDLDNFDLDFGDDDDEGQTLREIFPNLVKVDTPEVVQAKDMVKKVLVSSSLPAMGEEMDLFQQALKTLQKSNLFGSEEVERISTLLAETPRLVAEMNETAKTLKISSNFFADVQAKEFTFQEKKDHLQAIVAKNKAGQAKVHELKGILENLRSQVKKVEEELKSYDDIAASKDECDASYLELAQLHKELKKKKTLVPAAEEKKKAAEENLSTLLGQWEALVKDNSFLL